MADVEEKAEAEAHKKGLDEEETERYVGGTFNRIKQRQGGGYASPHRKRVNRKEEKEEESRHWKKYHQHSDSEMNYRIRDSYKELSPRGRSQAQAHFRREGLTTEYDKQSRRDKEKMLEHLENAKAKHPRTKPAPIEDEDRPRRKKLKGAKATWLQR
jgi:hypothetical protein